jgi:gluconolactonase
VSPTAIYELGTDGVTTSIFRQNAQTPEPANGANGNAIDKMGRLVTCEGKSRVVVRSPATKGAPKETPALASAFGGLPFNSPNDVIVRSDGNIYFTDPDYGADPDAAAPRQPGQSVFRINPAGMITKVKQFTSEPNGIAISPDGNTLYVADTTANVINYWSLAADGTATEKGKFADVNGGDGIAVDDAGNLYVAAETGIEVFDNTGTGLGTITVPEQPSNCTFGGTDRKTLYITARTGLYKIKLNVPGLP